MRRKVGQQGHDIEAEGRAKSDAALAQLLTRDERERYARHARLGVAHLLVGSVAENVVRKAPCPVLTVPVAGHDFVKPQAEINSTETGRSCAYPGCRIVNTGQCAALTTCWVVEPKRVKSTAPRPCTPITIKSA